MRSLLWLALGMAPVAPSAAAQSAAAVEVPLSIVSGRLVVPVLTSDGEELRFALTTASATTILAESVAERLGPGAGLTLGGQAVPTEDAATLADGRLSANGSPLHGMIAPNMLRDYDLLIDAPGGRLVLKPVGRGVSWSDVSLSDPVPLRILHGIVIGLDVTLDGREYPASIDLGTPTVVVNAAVKEELGLDDVDTASLGFGVATLTGTPLRVVDDNALLHRWSPGGAAFVIVGAAIAEGCPVSLSWAHRELRVCAR